MPKDHRSIVGRAPALVVTVAALLLGTACHPRAGSVRGAGGDPGWIWSGAATSTSARVVARLPAAVSRELLVSRERSLEPAVRVAPLEVSPRRVATWDVTGLAPGSRYYYAVSGGSEPTALRGTFRTFGEGPTSFSFAVSACARTGSSHPVFDAIRERDPAFFLHLGDLHYENIRRPRPEAYRRAFERVLASPAQSALYRAVPLVYVWDDHDFGGDGADRTNPGRAAARGVYQEVVPHYPLVAGKGDVPIYQAFTVGRVRFLITDSRSEKTSPAVRGSRRTVLGRSQREWLERELRSARAEGHAMVVIATSLPWIGPARAWSEDWGGYAAERRELAEVIAEPEVPPVLMVSGDAHMLALDDGSHNRYAGDGPGFAVLQAGALDQHGSVKGGPYSQGPFPGGGHFGWVEIRDDGKAIDLTVTGLDAAGRELLRYERRYETP